MKFLRIILFCVSVFGLSQNNQPKIGLVLSGGGAKGFAHIEALKAIEKAGIKLDYISGTSMGAIVGGLYAAGYNAQQLDSMLQSLDFENILLNEKKRKFIKFNDKEKNEKYIIEIPLDNFKIKIPSSISKGQATLSTLSKYLRHIPSNSNYNNLPTPFLCIATNIETGESYEMNSGFLPKSILASSAFPLLLKPVEIDSILLSDGGLVNNYPAKELKEKGIDIIIGVNVSKKLATKNNLKTGTQILEQIGYYQVIKRVEEQKKYVDVEINPSVDHFLVTDFGLKKEILFEGKKAAELVQNKLDSIAKLQGFFYKKPKLNFIDDVNKIKIDEIQVHGNQQITTNYIKNKIFLNLKRKTTYHEIDLAIENLYSSGYFDNVSYYFSSDINKKSILNIDVEENNERFKAKVSMNYNDVFKTGILLNLSKINLFVRNSKLALDVVLGDNFRYYLDYFVDNGLIPSIGFSSSLISYPYKITSNARLFSATAYLRSTFRERFATEVGIDYFSSKIKTPDIKTIESENYLLPYASIKLDTRDDNYFPKKGLKFKAISRFNFISGQENFTKYILLNGNFESHIPIYKFIVSTKASFGTTFGNPNTELFKNRSGGVFNQELLNFERFFGYDFDEIKGNHRLSIFGELRYEVYKKHFISFYANYLNMEDDLLKLQFLNYKYNGYGISYGYNSPFGPLQFFYTYSTHLKSSTFNVNLGYTF